MGNIDNLRAIAQIIQREDQDGANTADRVGSLLVDVINELGAAESSIGSIESRIIESSSFTRLRESIVQLQNELNNVLDRNREGIIQMINEILDSKHFIDGWQSGWDEKIRAYLIQVGILNADGSKGWSYLSVKANEIEAVVNRLITAFSDDEGRIIGLEAIQALIRQYIDDNNHAIIELLSKYALTDDENSVLKWLTAGFRSEAAADKAVAEVFASMENINSAIALLRTEVTENFVAKASLSTQVNDMINNRIYTSGFLTESNLEGALATMFATDNRATAAITAKVQSGISVIEVSAEQIHNISEQFYITMDKFLMGSKDRGLLFQTFSKDGYDGFEFAVGEFVDDGQGRLNPVSGKPLNRIIFNALYSDLPTLLVDHLMVGTEAAADRVNIMDISSKTTINWYHRIGACHSDLQNGTYKSGQMAGFDADGVDIEHSTPEQIYQNENSHVGIKSGYIEFVGTTIKIHGNLEVTGTINGTTIPPSSN